MSQFSIYIHQIVERGDNKAKAEESVRSKPGEEERAEGEEEAQEKQEGGCQRNLGGRKKCKLDQIGQERSTRWTRISIEKE